MLKELKEWLKEEISDENKYLEMAEKAPDKYKGILRDIGNEERNHAKLLKEILDDCCGCEMEDSGSTENHNEKTASSVSSEVNKQAVKELFNLQ